jgi:hypothetical protein
MFLTLLLTLPAASAGSCDKQISALKSATPEAVAGAYAALAKCDKATAEASFNDALTRATNVEALSSLAFVAIDGEMWKPMWGALGKISDYEARDEVARAVGTACAERPLVVTYLQGAYMGLRDIEFQQWDDAFVACDDAGLTAWMEKEIKNPPKKKFDEKFVNLMAIYIKKAGLGALPVLTESAVAAAADGPFEAVLFKIGEAAQPEMGSTNTPEIQAKFESAMVEVASKVDKEKAMAVASQLANNGSEGAAAKLLPVLYGNVAKGGVYTYGAASVEAGDCAGKKQAILHVANVDEPGTRWSILRDLEPELRSSKAKLKGCTTEDPWPVMHTPAPVSGKSEVDQWLKEVQADWEGRGYAVKVQKEKTITLAAAS